MAPFVLSNLQRGRFRRAVQWISARGLVAALFATAALAAPLPQLEGDLNPKVRVFVTESNSWSVSGEAAGIRGTGGGSLQGGAKPQTAEIMKTINKRRECRGIVVTINRDKADYVLMLERVGGRGVVQKDNKMALFDRDGDMVATSSTRSLGNAVKDACQAIRNR